MQSTRSIYICGNSSKPGRASSYLVFFFGWMQSTGQASTQAVSFVPMQDSAITKAIGHLRPSEPTVRHQGARRLKRNDARASGNVGDISLHCLPNRLLATTQRRFGQ